MYVAFGISLTLALPGAVHRAFESSFFLSQSAGGMCMFTSEPDVIQRGHIIEKGT